MIAARLLESLPDAKSPSDQRYKPVASTLQPQRHTGPGRCSPRRSTIADLQLLGNLPRAYREAQRPSPSQLQSPQYRPQSVPRSEPPLRSQATRVATKQRRFSPRGSAELIRGRLGPSADFASPAHPKSQAQTAAPNRRRERPSWCKATGERATRDPLAADDPSTTPGKGRQPPSPKGRRECRSVNWP
jgi:hypothetical protein